MCFELLQMWGVGLWGLDFHPMNDSWLSGIIYLIFKDLTNNGLFAI